MNTAGVSSWGTLNRSWLNVMCSTSKVSKLGVTVTSDKITTRLIPNMIGTAGYYNIRRVLGASTAHIVEETAELPRIGIATLP